MPDPHLSDAAPGDVGVRKEDVAPGRTRSAEMAGCVKRKDPARAHNASEVIGVWKARALDAAGFLLGVGQRREQHARQDHEDSYDDRESNESKCAGVCVIAIHRCSGF